MFSDKCHDKLLFNLCRLFRTYADYTGGKDILFKRPFEQSGVIITLLSFQIKITATMNVQSCFVLPLSLYFSLFLISHPKRGGFKH